MTLKFDDRDEGICSCGKIRYRSEADAQKIMEEKGGTWLDLHVYQCTGYWHLGHPRPGGRNTRRARARRGR